MVPSRFLLDHTTPSARTNEASRLFLIVQPSPPPAEEEESRLLQLSKRFGNLDSAALNDPTIVVWCECRCAYSDFNAIDGLTRAAVHAGTALAIADTPTSSTMTPM